jgi:signal transduction histidine kinase
MRANLPLAAPVAGDHDRLQDQLQDPERSVVSPPAFTSLGEPAWETFYALVFIASVILIQSEHLATAERVAASVALAAMIPWYLFVGRPLFQMSRECWSELVLTLRGPVYLTGMIALFAVTQHANPNAWFLAFAISPQCFNVTTQRRAMGFVIAFNCVAAAMVIVDSPTGPNIAGAAGIATFAIAFSLVYSRWTMRVLEQSQERAVLIAQLESAQAELAAAYHEAGVHAERQRLATEIHDTLAQGFLSIVTLVQAAQATHAEVAEANAGDEYLELALATARESLAEARALVTALAPVGLQDAAGLAGAIARAASATGKAAGIESAWAAEGDRRPLPTATEVVLLRVCQEALANVRKHAAATRVDVRLRYRAGAVELTVTDDGRGFTAAPAEASTGFGLRSMGERLRQVGGTLTVASSPGAGTTIRAEIPT